MIINKDTDKTIIAKCIVEKEYEPYFETFTNWDEPDLPEEGKKYFVWCISNTMKKGGDDYHLRFSSDQELINNGMGGNSNHNIKRFHGWRGTTNDIAVHACGVRICEKVIVKDYIKTTHYRVVFGEDLAIDKE